MKSLQGVSEIVVLLLIFGSISIVSSISILASKQNNLDSCQLNPNNRRCSLNRSMDITTKKNQNKSFQSLQST